MTVQRIRSLLAGSGITALAITAFALSGGSPASPAIAGDASATAQAESLASAPADEQFDTKHPVASPVIEGRAAALARAIPLPPGKAFNDLDLSRTAYSDAEVEGILEFNAACKWWIANTDAPTKQTAQVVHTIPSWPTMRGDGDRHRAALAFVRSGDAEFASGVLSFCRASVH